MVTYDSADLYIETATGKKDRIAKIDIIIERTKQIYINQVNGRTFRLVDGKSFRR